MNLDWREGPPVPWNLNVNVHSHGNGFFRLFLLCRAGGGPGRWRGRGVGDRARLLGPVPEGLGTARPGDVSFNSRSPASSPPSTPWAPSASSWSWYLRPALPAVETGRLSPAVPWLNGAAWVSGGGPSGRATPFLLAASTESPPVWVALTLFQASSGLDKPGSHFSLPLGIAKEKVNKSRPCLSPSKACLRPVPTVNRPGRPWSPPLVPIRLYTLGGFIPGS